MPADGSFQEEGGINLVALNVVDDDPALRPRKLDDFYGQDRVRALLAMELIGSRSRGEQMDHVLLYGPPGLGKTTLANIIALEMGAGFYSMAAPMIERPADLAGTLVALQPGDVLFLDEIHRLPPPVEEVLYGAMEDFALTVSAGDSSAPKPISIPISRFTLVGATTRPGMLTRPLRDRFGVDAALEPYPDDDLAHIINRSSRLLGMKLHDGVALEVATRSRGTPRLANRLLRRVRNFAAQEGTKEVSRDIAQRAFDFLRIDDRGLDARDRRYLDCLRARYQGRPVGLETLAAALNESPDTLKDEVEPWLLSQGLIDRTQRGRVLGPAGVGSKGILTRLL